MKRDSGARLICAAAVLMSLQGTAIAPLGPLAAHLNIEPVVQRSGLIRPITPIDRIELPRDPSRR
ncbi:hypothetical protein [Thermoleptolyngbya sp.]